MKAVKKSTKFAITLCNGTSCIHNNAKKLEAAIVFQLKKYGIAEDTRIVLSGCLGMCAKGPVMIINPGYTIYGNVKEEDIPEIIESHFIKNSPVVRLIIQEDHLYNRFFRIFGDIDFFGKQMRIALRNCGIIDPESIDDYLSLRGYEA